MSLSQASQHKTVETLRWENDCLELIDQRQLPREIIYIPCHSAHEVADCIRNMVVRGAPAIGCTAAYGVALEALRLQQETKAVFDQVLTQGFKRLEASRPTAVNLFWALARMHDIWLSCAKKAPVEIAQRLLDEAHTIKAEDIQINKTLSDHGATLFSSGMQVLTHCNAGALATAGYGTALGVIRSAVAMGKKISVFVDETRPLLQGARLSAWELLQENIPATLITDNMAGYLMQQSRIDAIIVGADRVAANGDVANKIGTYALAVLAKHHQIPFYVACPVSTIDPKTATGQEIPVEIRDEKEVTGYGECQWAADIPAYNPAFDVTPASLVSALITQTGILYRPDQAGIAKLLYSNTQ